VFKDADGEFVEVMFEGGQVLASVAHGQPYWNDIHEDVALPVILASRGMDSLEALAAAMLETGHCLELEAVTHDGHGDRETACIRSGEALGLRIAAAMLRRGTVKP
jgi:hypothetical protein